MYANYFVSQLAYIFGLIIFSASVYGQVKIDTGIAQRLSVQEKVDVIIILKNKPNFKYVDPDWTKNQKSTYVYSTLTEHSEISQSKVISLLKEHNKSFQAFYVVNAIKTTLDQGLLTILSGRDDIFAIMEDAPIKMLDYIVENDNVTQNRTVDPEWGIKKIKADSVWLQGFEGQGVSIGGLDTGFEWDYDVLRSKYRGFNNGTIDHNYHWHDAIHINNPAYPDTLLNPCGFNSTEPCDDNNHGTHTMGTMIGSDDNNLIGVAPKAQWVACRNMDRGWGKPSTYLECFEWMLAPTDSNNLNADPTKSPHVINNSWYCSEGEGCNPMNQYLLEDAVKNLKAAGIFVVVSNGNFGPNCNTTTGPPAMFESSFSVGATNSVDTIAGFSSRGPGLVDSILTMKPNVSAPGVNVRSIIRNGTFANFSGTSMAGPHVAGAVALIISANPALAGKVSIIEDILESTADPIQANQECGGISGTMIPNPVYGYGRINVFMAVAKARSLIVSATNDNKKNDLVKVFPNPTSDYINFTCDNGQIKQVSLYDYSGKMLNSVEFFSQQSLVAFPVNALSSGLFIAKIVTSNGSQVVKFEKI